MAQTACPSPARLLLAPLLVAAAACSSADGNGPPGESASAAAGGATPSARAGAEDVTVRGVAGSYDLGDYFIRGEVVNGLDEPIYEVELEVTYRGPGGEVLATDEAAAVLAVVEPGATAPFADTHYSAPEDIQGHTVTVKRFSRESLVPFRPLTILGTASRAGITGAVVTGQARNDAGVPLSGVKLVTSFRNQAGEVTGVYFDYPVQGTMAPGQVVDFTVETMDETVAADRVLVQGEGRGGS